MTLIKQSTVLSIGEDVLRSESVNLMRGKDSEAAALERLLWYMEWGSNLRRPAFNGLDYNDRLKKAFQQEGGSYSLYEVGNMYYRGILLEQMAKK